MDVNLSASSLTYKSIGGILDFYFLLGPEPLTLTTQYTDLVGRPFMPPLWSMGWHQCKWGYSSANYTLQVVLNYTAADIPLDVIWNDIDWMRDYVAFTYNDELGSGGFTAKDVRALNDYLAANQQYHVQIVDPNIPVILLDKDKQPYLPYVNGKANNLFVRHPANDTFLFGKQWPAVTVAWPDWTNPGVESWWEDNFRRFGEIAGQLGGVWLDMNEPSNFCDGQISASCIGSADSSRQLDPIAVPHPPVSSPTDIPLPPYEPYLGRPSSAVELVQHQRPSLPRTVVQREGLLGNDGAARYCHRHGQPPPVAALHTVPLHVHGQRLLGRALAGRQQQRLGQPATGRSQRCSVWDCTASR